MKISEAFKMYINLKILPAGGADSTVQNYQYAGRRAVKYFGDIRIAKLSMEKIAQYNVALQREHRQRTARGYMLCLKAVIGFCRRRGMHVIDPDDIIVPKPPKDEPLFLEKKQVDELILAAGRPSRGYPAVNRVRNVLIIKILFATGLRVGELCALDRDSIANRQFHVTGKSKDTRPCFIPDELERELDKYLKMRRDDSRALFVSSQTGARISKKSVQDMFRRIRKEAKLGPVHPHTLRHSFGTYLVSNGMDIRVVAELMGHQSLNTTKHYTHLRSPQLKEQYDLFMGE